MTSGLAMAAAVLHHEHEALVVQEVEVIEPLAGEVLVKVAASGVCRSDLSVVEGHSPVAHLPMVLGHEGAGIVAAVGPGVTSVVPGDHVVIALYGPCGRCQQCRTGRPTRCDGPARQSTFGLMADGTTRLRLGGEPIRPFVGAGTMAEYSVVAEPMVVRIPSDVPLAAAALTGCGVTTGVGAVFNVARVEPGDTVAVVGCGGVGLNVVQAARVAGAARIVAIDTVPSKLDLAADFGATDCVCSGPGGTEDPVRAVLELVPGGVDVAFEVVGSPTLVRQAFAMTAPGGTAVMVGGPPPGADVSVDGRMLFADRRLLGCIGGQNVPARDIPRIIALYRQGRLKLDELITRRFPLEEVNEAFAALGAGEVARSVLVIDEGAAGEPGEGA